VAELDAVERAVKDAIREIRNISRGVSLPEIEARPICALVQSVADTHAARTGTEVAVSCRVRGSEDLPVAVKICVYRFVQEGLNNAWRYADGKGQEVRLGLDEGILRLSVLDRGPGFSGLAAGAGSMAKPAVWGFRGCRTGWKAWAGNSRSATGRRREARN
jgi:signal transduction histidine kinase